MNQPKNNHRRALSNNDFQQILNSKISELLEENNTHKIIHKNQSFGNVLFQIPEQTDIASSTEQSMQSAKKTQLFDQSHKNNHSQEQKENLKNQGSSSNLISHIQYMIKGNHPIKEITQKTLNSERQDKNKHLSFTNELQKKHSQIILQSNNNNDSSSLTPDRNRAEENGSKLNSHKNKSDQQEKSKIELSSSLFNTILKVDGKRKLNVEQQESYRRIEVQMNKIQKDINNIKMRQDQLDQFNRNIQNQLCDFMTESKIQQDYGHQSLQKLEQLEQITKRNEESIQLIKQQLILDQSKQINKGNENIINFGNLTFYKQDSDQFKKFIHLKSNNIL
ncbi:unnamed protein product (macronuclear) [Paramecium tetraurelia]|uniref:Uncharacterized protein n=1 Tax=Paramecium tetraurelia TaxID=5888 RepID=A0E598_PARTE|nr:uncharacterized protein GSPATT00023642001 [Paramecium tetraurelia]CAK90465.1 unnamed protein product [Paramecium tetraurelia]|eukprot:XP_001457862.1 hypothetical protein (macronuclear) [Paramecium tetraurelia strain d4-2]